MPTFKYAKLVRDNIADWHLQSGHTLVSYQLTKADLLRALVGKLHEEADEVSASETRESLIEELADVQEVLLTIAEHEGITLGDIEAVRMAKANRKGGFSKGIYIESVTMPNEDDKWVQYCRQSPDKYPEISE